MPLALSSHARDKHDPMSPTNTSLNPNDYLLTPPNANNNAFAISLRRPPVGTIRPNKRTTL